MGRWPDGRKEMFTADDKVKQSDPAKLKDGIMEIVQAEFPALRQES